MKSDLENFSFEEVTYLMARAYQLDHQRDVVNEAKELLRLYSNNLRTTSQVINLVQMASGMIHDKQDLNSLSYFYGWLPKDAKIKEISQTDTFF